MAKQVPNTDKGRDTVLNRSFQVGVDRLSAPILSILPIIDIGHFQNRFADNLFFYNANKHTTRAVTVLDFSLPHY